MEPETTSSPSGKKTFLKIALGVLVIILVLATTAFILTEQKNAKLATKQPEVLAPTVASPHLYTDEEKRQALEAFTKQASASTTSEAEKLRVIEKFSAKATAPILSDEEKKKALIDFATRIPLAP